MNATLIILLLLCVVINFTHGKRGFEINLDTIRCTFNPKYISTADCFIDKTIKHGRLFVNITVINEVPEFKYFLDVILIRGKKERMSLLSIKDGDGCAFIDGKAEATLLRIYRDIIADSGDLPKCPVPKNYNIVLKNMGIDVEKFPPYLPETNFSVIPQFKIGKEQVFLLELNGSCIQKRKLGGIG